ncbi:MAG: hypothetical protein ACK5NF_00145 [Bacilli bacterium]
MFNDFNFVSGCSNLNKESKSNDSKKNETEITTLDYYNIAVDKIESNSNDSKKNETEITTLDYYNIAVDKIESNSNGSKKNETEITTLDYYNIAVDKIESNSIGSVLGNAEYGNFYGYSGNHDIGGGIKKGDIWLNLSESSMCTNNEFKLNSKLK